MIAGAPHPDPARIAALLPPRPLVADPFRPPRPSWDSPALAKIVSNLGGPVMAQDVRFALVRKPLQPHAKPVTKATLRDLARAIHSDRQGRPIQLQDAPLVVLGWGELQGVSVFTLTADGAPHVYLGWAWLNGRPRQVLESALASVEANAPTIGRAA